ncbi:bifunctional [glutamate--ammonia ligase]-adenylyl-L-tyrosine phosphorylase/[glutamate--ammonia-ligase] adenylyltransferase [Thiotrichales bacterium 19S11-10]|nr:bifunctional [glutamate--ammonia ligase]-adenylyl-L-tyrosine phosphorylase/[glutamate--ammonia-ligase] adenylyltransferase [Thiotrichales bacterium 19S11-10]
MSEDRPLSPVTLSILSKLEADSNLSLTDGKIARFLESSLFVQQFAQQHTALFIKAVQIGWDLNYHEQFNIFESYQTFSDLSQKLRIFRKFHSVNIIYQMMIQKRKMEEIIAHLSALADALVLIALENVELSIKKRFRLDSLESMIVLALGKLGGRELNFSSDIDLIFLYDEEKVSGFDAIRIYTYIAQALVNLLNALTVDGFVFRVDLRLRPFGEGSPLVTSIDAFESYCLKHARDWERYALIKSRQLTDNNQKLSRIIQSFVYRKYIDYTVLNAIRLMKEKILSDMKRDKLKDNLKLGRGGIREIEFIVQCYQLIYGGQNRHLRANELSKGLCNLAKYQHIDKDDADCLWESYVFLRNFENALQMINDQQRHHLPKKEINQYRVSEILGYKNWQALEEDYQQVVQDVQTVFDQLTHFSELNLSSKKENEIPQIKSLDKPMTIGAQLRLEKELDKFKSNPNISEASIKSIEVLLELFEKEIIKFKETEQLSLLSVITKLLKTISRRSTYLHQLIESKDQLEQLVDVLSIGEWFSERIIQFPHLLEVILNLSDDYDKLYLDKSAYQLMINNRLEQVEISDREEALEILRRLKVEEVFKVALAEHRRNLTLMETSDVLSALAEAFTDQILDIAWDKVKQKFDFKPDELKKLKSSLSIIAYGKLGGYELGFGSDLDLIFLYQTQAGINNETRIYAKVVQTFVSLMQTRSYSGRLYSVDLRLRPSGETGLLVSSIDAFKIYQLNQAWTWEHQALTRARWIAGSQEVKEIFNKIRFQILKKERNDNELKQQVLAMRIKMNENLYKPKQGYFDIKYSPGGMIDIEFLAQYMALAYTQKHEEISIFTDNIRIFQSMESAQLLSFEQAQLLVEAYCFYRDLSYECVFKNKPLLVEIDKVKPYDNKIVTIYHQWLVNDRG